MLNMRATMWGWGGSLVLLMFATSRLYSFFSKHFSDQHNSWKSAIIEEENDEMKLEDDAKLYAAQLQVEDALLATMLIASQPNNEQEKEECTICLEEHEHCQMLKLSSSCSHSFCSECITKHATTKIQDKNKSITCPGVNCKSTLDFNTLRQLIPKETLVKWDEFLCESMIPESQKLYCPFSKCSVLLLVNNDTRNKITKVDCPACRQTFCAACRVPWHSNLTCKQFGKREDDDVAVAFARKKKWMRCPNCNFFVERVDGCKHIVCRCKCSFCYVCGVEWNYTHIGGKCYWAKFIYS